MKLNTSLFALTVLLIAAACGKKTEPAETHAHDSATVASPDTVKKSIPKEEHARVGDAHLTIKYHAPAVRGRIIWGGLVPYGEIWVTGAHDATSLEIDKAFVVNGTEIPAGKYAFFTIPDKETWTIILNKNWEQHMTGEYDQKDDIIRVVVKPVTVNEHQERLEYSIVSSSPSEGTLQMTWEKLRVELPFKLE